MYMTKAIHSQWKVSMLIFVTIFLFLPDGSRCFPRSLETLKAVISVFAAAYNRFHLAVFNFRLHSPKREFPLGLVDFL